MAGGSAPKTASEPDALELSFALERNGRPRIEYDPLRRLTDKTNQPVYFRAAVRVDAIRGRVLNNPSNVEVWLYWATGPDRGHTLGLASKQTRTVNRMRNRAGDVLDFHFDKLETRQPGRATHLVGVIDPNNRLKGEEKVKGDNVRGVEVKSAGDLASLVLFASGDIKLATTHVSGNVDQATASHNIRDVQFGRKARRSSYKDGKLTGPGGSTDLDVRMLTAMLELTRTYRFRVSEIAGGVHGANSRHYAGLGLDIDQINGVAVSASNGHVGGLVALAKRLGATEVKQPGDPGHGGHVHLAWSRIPEIT